MSHSIDDDVCVELSDRDILDALEDESGGLDFLFEWMRTISAWASVSATSTPDDGLYDTATQV